MSPALRKVGLVVIVSASLAGCGGASDSSGSPDSNTPCTWRNLGTFQLSSTYDSIGYGVGVDGAGNVFSVGSANSAATGTEWLVRKSSDLGSSWTNVDPFQAQSGSNAVAYSFGTDTAGNLYVVGSGWTNSGTNYDHWLVRKSLAGGTSWSTVDNVSGAAGYGTEAIAITRDSGGTLYVGGYLNTNGAGLRWTVRKSANLGSSWSSSDDYVYASTTGNASVQALAADGVGAVYAVGYARDTAPKSHWITRKSVSGGSWSTVDDFQYVSGGDSKALGVGVDSSGTIYVAGYGSNVAGSANHWIVRKSSNSGATWSTVDDFVYPTDSSTNPNGQAHSVTFDSSGALYVAGYGSTFSGAQHFISVVRKSTDQGTTWSTVDTFQPLANVDDGSGFAIAADASGHLFLVGESTTAYNGWMNRACL